MLEYNERERKKKGEKLELSVVILVVKSYFIILYCIIFKL